MPHPPLESKQRRPVPLFAPRHCLAAGLTFYLLMILVGSLPGAAAAAAAAAAVPDKLLHFCAYTVIAVLLYRGLRGKPGARAAQAVAMGAFLGGLDEAIQMLFPYRTADWSDWQFDVIAVLGAVGLSVAATVLTAARLQRRSMTVGELPVSPRQRRDEQFSLTETLSK
jgi:VanZ family protein